MQKALLLKRWSFNKKELKSSNEVIPTSDSGSLSTLLYLSYSKYCTLQVTSRFLHPALLLQILLLEQFSADCLCSNSSTSLSLHPAQALFSLLPQVLCVGYSLVQDALLAPESLDLQLEQTDVFHELVVVEVPLAQD